MECIPITRLFGRTSAAASLPILFPTEVRILKVMHSHGYYELSPRSSPLFLTHLIPRTSAVLHHEFFFWVDTNPPNLHQARPRAGSCASRSSSEARASAANCLEVAGTNKKTSSAKDMRKAGGYPKIKIATDVRLYTNMWKLYDIIV